MPILGPKQIRSIAESTARQNIWEGSVRSGKTHASILRYMQELVEGPPGDTMIVGVSRDTIQRNIVRPLFRMMNFPCPSPKTTEVTVCDRPMYFVGANDERAQKRIQGSTLASAYVDEVTNIPQGFYRMLLTRLSVAGAKLFGTTNPDNPFHWFKTEYLDNEELNLKRFKFRLNDNPSLSNEYVQALKAEFSGLWYKRYILGDWVLADGVVFDMFDEEVHVIEAPPTGAQYYIVGVDYGTSNPTAFGMIGINTSVHPNFWKEKEYYYSSRESGRQKTDSEYAEDLKKFVQSRNVKAIYVDPSAASFKLECQNIGLHQVMDAKNDVINGIRFVSQLISNGTYKVCRSCPNTIREFGSYVWDEKACARGEDKPVKEHDHCIDSDRYALFSHLGHGQRLITPGEMINIHNKAMGNGPALAPQFQNPNYDFY